jgi:glutathione S-transferase
MKLYDGLGPNPRIVRIALAEKGLAPEIIPVDLIANANRAPEHLARNPLGGLPSLETDDGRHLAEVTALVEYLEDLQPEPPLIGTTPEDRAETRMWTRRIDLGLAEPLMMGFRATRARAFFAPRMPLLSESAGEEMLARASAFLAFLDTHLAGRPFVTGPSFTLADILLFAFVDSADQFGLTLPASPAWLPAWQSRIHERSSAKA